MKTKITSGIVSILRSDGTIAGTGFVVSEKGHISTCAHVIESAQAGHGDEVMVRFQDVGYECRARAIKKWWRDSSREDVAILQLKSELPDRVSPLKLGSSAGTADHKVRIFGYPEVGTVEGVWAKGEVLGRVTENGRAWIQLRTGEITTGFSGAPVFDESRQRVIGMVVTITESDEYDRLKETAFIIPVETLQSICPELVIKDICPYRGLFPFMEEDVNLFFGRTALINELSNHLRQNPSFLAVVGSSGSGKSSVIQAGLLPKLRHGDIPGFQNVKIITLRPGATPVEALKQATLDSGIFKEGSGDTPWDSIKSYLTKEPDTRAILFADQFEELFSLSSEPERMQFLGVLSGLLKSCLPVTLIITMRADFYEPLLDTILGKYLRTAQFNIRPMSEEEIQEIITKPAESVGLEIEAGLVDTIIRDLKHTKNPLSLLEFALTQLWLYRDEGVLTHEGYRKIKGVTGAIGRWATEAYNQLNEKERQLTQRIFTRLVHYGEGDIPDTRRRSPFAELVGSGDEKIIIPLIKKLADFRLLVTDRDSASGIETADIVHDALLREWLQLREWIREQRRFLLWRQRLDEKFKDWIKEEQDEGSLLRGTSLIEAQNWFAQRRENLSISECKYIQVSLDLQKKEQSDKERRKRYIMVGLIVFSIIMLVLAGIAAWQWQETRASQLAFKSEIVRQNSANLAQSILMAIESLKLKNTLEGDQALYHAMENLPAPVWRMGHGGPVVAVAFSPDGKLMATASEDRTVKIWDTSTGDSIINIKPEIMIDPSGTVDMDAIEFNVIALAFSPDGKLLATASEDRNASIWYVENGSESVRMSHDDSVQNVAFSPDGKLLATASQDRTARVWNVKNGSERVRVNHSDDVWHVIFSPDGKLLATASLDRTARVWYVENGSERVQVNHGDDVNVVKFSPDGTLLATGSWDSTAGLWNVSTGERIATMNHSDSVQNVAFSPNGKFLATASRDNTARVFYVTNGTRIAKMKHNDDVWDIVFSPDGKLLATASRDGTARLWNSSNGQQLAIRNHDGSVDDVIFSSDGKYIATASADKSARLWNTPTGKEIPVLNHDDEVWKVEFSPDGKLLATASLDNTARIWDVATGNEIARMNHDKPVVAVKFSISGKLLATGSRDNTARIWDVTTGRELARMKHEDNVWGVSFSHNEKYLATASGDYTSGLWDIIAVDPRVESIVEPNNIFSFKHDSYVKEVAFSSDDMYILTGSWDNTSRLWYVGNGSEYARMKHDGPVVAIAFSPDGKYVATGSWDGKARIWYVGSEKEHRIFDHDDYVNAVNFSPNGKFLVTASRDGMARIWDVEKNKTIRVMKHDADVKEVAFSPDGAYLVTASDDSTARIWDVTKDREMARRNHDDSVLDAAFSSDGKYIATGSKDYTARLWLWKPEDIINKACSSLTLHNFTQKELNDSIGEGGEYQTTCT
ncbi:trypsin-like peptidase domain-containing protein [Candidatus Pacearchaeota archaeon]|nr:trypsin-like peptidase domain-containing protein [Candidatus Pacearchaeota archaeon]